MFGLKKRTVICGFVALCLAIGIIIAIVVVTQRSDNEDQWGPKLVSNSVLGKYKKAAVSSNGARCSEIGVGVLKKNGSAVDAAIATLLCEGVSSLHSMGLGGGFLMTIWDAEKNESTFLDARETAPGAADREMFKGNATLSIFGGMAIAVPGELMGYWEAHQRYGKLPWRDLFQPTIAFCNEGVTVNQYLAESLSKKLGYILEQPSLTEILIDPKTGSTWTIGDKIKRPKLSKTLELIADNGVSIFYNGSMGEELIREIKTFGGIMEMDDLRNYRAKWKHPIIDTIGDLTIHTAPPPGSGAIVTFIMNVLEGIVPTPSEADFWQRVVETFKWAYARRTELGDEDFVDIDAVKANLTSKKYAAEIREKIKDNWTSNNPKYYGVDVKLPDDSGTSHVSVLAPDGSAVSVTSTINQVLGAMRRSVSTGIIFNDEMDDFSSPGMQNGFELPPSPANFIHPGKRPMSSMVPTIVVDKKNQVQLVIGAAGGTKITSAVSLAMILNIWSGYNIKEALDARRLHHQVLPMQIYAEPQFPEPLLKHLMSIGHNITFYSGIGSAVCAISRLNHEGITANSDYRRMGGVDGF